MANITAQMVKELREATGAAVLDCKNALEQHNGDMEQAKQYLAEKGLATAQKKSSSTAAESTLLSIRREFSTSNPSSRSPSRNGNGPSR